MHHFLHSLFKDKLRSYQILALLLAIISILSIGAAFFFAHQIGKQQEDSVTETISPPTNGIPQYSQIMSIISPLQYSGLPTLLRNEVNLLINFTTQTWQLTNIHRFDKNGNLILEEGRYGLCGELASYTYTKIAPLLEPQYAIKFHQVAESGFFLQPQSSHIILMIYDKTDPTKTFLLDPSFARYGPLDSFDNYLFYGNRDNLEFIENQDKDITLPIDGGTPILIKNDRILLLSVETLDGKFDHKNFAIAITATRRFKYSGRYVLIIRKTEDNVDFFENTYLATKLFDQKTYQDLKNKIIFWVNHQN